MKKKTVSREDVEAMISRDLNRVRGDKEFKDNNGLQFPHLDEVYETSPKRGDRINRLAAFQKLKLDANSKYDRGDNNGDE